MERRIKRRFRPEDGIFDYQAGDILIEESDGGTVIQAVRTGSGVQLEPWTGPLPPGPEIVPYDLAEDAAEIELRLHPIDVGWDLRVQGVPVLVPPGTTRAAYADKRGARMVVSGTRDDVVRVLRDAGYAVAD